MNLFKGLESLLEQVDQQAKKLASAQDEGMPLPLPSSFRHPPPSQRSDAYSFV